MRPAEKINVAFNEIRINSIISHRRPSWKRALALKERGVINNELLISHKLSLEEWKRAFDMVENRECVKVILIP